MIKNTRTTIIRLLETAGAREEGNPPIEDVPSKMPGSRNRKK